MKTNIIARIALFAAFALFAVWYMPDDSAPKNGSPQTLVTDATFSLTLDTLDGNRYISDTGLTLDDCGNAMLENPGRGWGCQRETPGMPL